MAHEISTGFHFRNTRDCEFSRYRVLVYILEIAVVQKIASIQVHLDRSLVSVLLVVGGILNDVAERRIRSNQKGSINNDKLYAPVTSTYIQNFALYTVHPQIIKQTITARQDSISVYMTRYSSSSCVFTRFHSCFCILRYPIV